MKLKTKLALMFITIPLWMPIALMILFAIDFWDAVVD